MIECYYKWCKHHDKLEPFCTLTNCIALPKDLKEFEQKRRKELKS